MKHKKGTIVIPNWQYIFMCHVVDYVFQSHVGHEAMITSGCEVIDENGKQIKHAATSKHWEHLGWDIRTRQYNDPAKPFYSDDILQKIVLGLKSYLGRMFDVVLESDHIHIEYDPK